jgi:MoxR-like ATPase
MFNVWVDYPDEDEELDIVKRTTADVETNITPKLSAEQIVNLTRIVRRVPIADHIARYAMQLARWTRRNHPDAPDFVREYVLWGAGPRASQYLVLGAKARAVLHGRRCVSQDDIQAVALPVLRHRIKTNFSADAEGVTADIVVQRLIDIVPTAADESRESGKSPKVFRSADAS